MTYRLLLLAIVFLISGCEEYKKNPDWPFPQFNSGESLRTTEDVQAGTPVAAPPCDEHNIRKTLTPCE